VHHQDLGGSDALLLDGMECKMEAVNPHREPAGEWKVQSWPAGKDGELWVEIVSSESYKELAGELLGRLCEILGKILEEPSAKIEV